MLVLTKPLWERVVAHCLDGLPFEACGLLAGLDPAPTSPATTLPTTGPTAAAVAADATYTAKVKVGLHQPAEVLEVYPAANASRSARLYTVEPRDLLAADRAAEQQGWSLIGVWHSHTHTPAYPSPTDIAQAPDPAWHYVVVSLADSEPVLRSYRIVGGEVFEERALRTPA